MIAKWKGEVVAKSDECIEIEGNQYFPPESVKMEFLKKNHYTTECVWKGTAHYYDVVVGDEVNVNATWYYPKPKEGSLEKVGQDFTNHVAFWNGVEVE